MKITAIRSAGLFGETPKGGWSDEIRPEDSVHALIAVHTDSGAIGLGSAFTDSRLVRAAIEVLERHYIGENALEPMRLAEKLSQTTFWMGMGGTLTHTISGIDIALWDILGKSAGQPVGRLLGGRYRDKVRPYASILMEMPDVMRDQAAAFRAKGFRAIKIGWGPFGRSDDPALDEAIVRAAREGAGDDCLLMVDAGASNTFWPHGLKWALRTADMVKEYDAYWLEEALRPDALDDFAVLRRQSRVPIATGECLTRRQSFLRWFAHGAMDIVQPDVTKVGGISEQIRIAWLANDFGIRYIGHGWNTAVGFAADLQLASALPAADLVEYIGGSPYVDDIKLGGWRLDNEGYVEIPETPGLGIELDRAQLARFMPDAGRLLDP